MARKSIPVTTKAFLEGLAVDAQPLNAHAVVKSFVDTASLLPFPSRRITEGMKIDLGSGYPTTSTQKSLRMSYVSFSRELVFLPPLEVLEVLDSGFEKIIKRCSLGQYFSSLRLRPQLSPTHSHLSTNN